MRRVPTKPEDFIMHACLLLSNRFKGYTRSSCANQLSKHSKACIFEWKIDGMGVGGDYRKGLDPETPKLTPSKSGLEHTIFYSTGHAAGLLRINDHPRHNIFDVNSGERQGCAPSSNLFNYADDLDTEQNSGGQKRGPSWLILLIKIMVIKFTGVTGSIVDQRYLSSERVCRYGR